MGQSKTSPDLKNGFRMGDWLIKPVSGELSRLGPPAWRFSPRALTRGSEQDRSTFLGFEGGGGIITSEEYCELAIWPDNNERTSPVIKGNIQVRP